MKEIEAYPQEIELKNEAIQLIEAGTFSVADLDSYTRAGTFVSNLVEKKKQVKKFFSLFKKREKEILEPLITAENYKRVQMSQYLTEEKRKHAEQQRLAELEAEKAAEAKKEELLNNAVNEVDPAVQEKILQQAEQIFTEPVIVKKEMEKTISIGNGVSVTAKKDMVIIITDIKKLLEEVVAGNVPDTIIKIETNKLKTWCKAGAKKGDDVPGITIKEVVIPLVRTEAMQP